MSYLIKETTTTERRAFVENALAISLLDAGEPTEETKKLAEAYVNGDIELEEMKRLIKERYEGGAKG